MLCFPEITDVGGFSSDKNSAYLFRGMFVVCENMLYGVGFARKDNVCRVPDSDRADRHLGFAVLQYSFEVAYFKCQSDYKNNPFLGQAY